MRGRRTIERLHFLRESQFWDRATLRDWQLARLNALLEHARASTGYYGQTLRDVKLPLASIEELANLPPLTKRAIVANHESLQSRTIPRSRFVPSRTGGSTGEPMRYFWDKRGQDWNRASVYRSAEWAGVALGERTVQMSGSHFDYTQSQKLQSRLVLWLQRYLELPVSVLTEELMEQYFRRLQSFRPTSIWGYASGTSAFAEYVVRAHPGAKLDFVRAVITSSETLRPEQRGAIEAAFGQGSVHDNYGSREMYIGAECRAHDGYHLHAEVLLVEVVDDDSKPCRPGELGRVLLTDLSNHAFPFIRYEIGDVGTMAMEADCPCGVRLPKLQSIQGRVADLVVLRDRVLTPPNFATMFSDKPGVRAYQVRQDSMDALEILIVPGAEYSDAVEDYLRSSVCALVGDGVRVGLRRVDDIPVPESGKRRYIVSSVGRVSAR
ncbi:MAG: hypothetical protein U1F18_08005 [Steroidobacteraceae bacterium]